MENYLKFIQFSVRCFYSNIEIIIIDYFSSQVIAGNYPLEETALITGLKFNQKKINESLAILEKGLILVKEEIDTLQQITNKEKKLIKKSIWKINPHIKQDLEPLINKLKKVIRDQQTQDNLIQMKCQLCQQKFLPEQFITNQINADQIGKRHGKKIYRCISIGCIGVLEEYSRSEKEKEESALNERNCEMTFQQLDEYLKQLIEGDWEKQERIIQEKKNIIIQQQLDMAKSNKEIDVTNKKLYNVYYSLKRRIIKKLYKERKNYATLFAMNKSDEHLSISEKLGKSTTNKSMTKQFIQEKIRMLKTMLENRNLYQAWSNEDYNRLFEEQKNQKSA